MTDNSSPSTSWPAPAKLNLFLHITGRREDGYHLLQTAFQFIDFCDELRFKVREDGVVNRVSGSVDVPPESDLVVRAARLLQEKAEVSQGVDIELNKHIPMGAGLGGGSSDAATTLVALNQLWELGWSRERLAELGLTLGADIPVFIYGQAAWAEGVGEQFEPISPPEPWYVVIIPPCHVSTPEIFNASDLTRDCPPLTIRDFLAGQGINVCESVVCKRYPQVADALEWLSQYAPARMSGTGSSVFAAFPNEEQARDIAQKVPDDWQGIVATGLNKSPLLST
ncbi:MAG: 4-(cytidine 5'-diphospho)-2-C-methyl-D-erythritol kinase [Gammaproteobacteria bacterium]|nr:4-(cytidine 5'-diphospho)-2-C-methyl-D-erythritol kinase [Gammaproteobacteria bacterium]MDH5613816.1 4-(cytidine 5'-diphospho)-2-C-methyl-D-erythritol kinase [Gammaproteobacteria bacterium]